MFLLTQPSAEQIGSFLTAQRGAEFSYARVGATRDMPARPVSPGHTLDRNRVLLGRGQRVFADAVAALCAWRMFETGLTGIYPRRAPVEVGQTVAVVARHFGFWSLNACRIVYLIDEAGEIEQRGFAYGTLAEHAESGEERFTVEHHRNSGEVWYDLLAFSRPRHPLARLGYPVSRMLQKRFAERSKLAIVRAVEEMRATT